jgi:hypothetical protein
MSSFGESRGDTPSACPADRFTCLYKKNHEEVERAVRTTVKPTPTSYGTTRASFDHIENVTTSKAKTMTVGMDTRRRHQLVT